MSCGPPPCPSPQAERGLPGASRVQFTMAFPASLSASVSIPAAKERQPAGGGPAGCDTGSGGGTATAPGRREQKPEPHRTNAIWQLPSIRTNTDFFLIS